MNGSDAALAGTLEQVCARNPYVKAHAGRPDGPDWLGLQDLTAEGAPHLDRLLAAVGDVNGTPRRDVMASFWFGGCAWMLAAVAVGAYLVDRRVPLLAPGAVRLRCDADGYVAEVAVAGDCFAALPDDPAAGCPEATVVADAAALRAALKRELATVLAPVVVAVRVRAPLGTRALWLAVADDIVSALVHHANGAGHGGEPGGAARIAAETEARCAAEAAALVRQPVDPWRSATGVIAVKAAGRRELFVARSSCCLSYKLPDGEKCTTCPLRPAEDRLRGMREELAART